MDSSSPYYKWYIYFPSPNVTSLYPELYFVLDIYLDVTLYEGSEYISIKGFGKTNETEWDDYNSEEKDVTVYDTEYLYESQTLCSLSICY